MPGTVAGVIFDMDGVLCVSDHFMVAAAAQMFVERFGIKVAKPDFLPFYGAGEDRFLGGVAEKHGVTLQMPEDKNRAYAIYLDSIRGKLQPLPGVKEFIATCRQRGCKTAVASSADRIKVEGNLRELELATGYFDVIVTGSDVARKKPDPEIFLASAASLGVPASACVVVEDAPSGIRAAKAAGCRCLGLTTSFDEATLRAAGADWVSADLTHVPAGVGI